MADAEQQLAEAEVQRDRFAAALSEAIESVLVVDQNGAEVFRNAARNGSATLVTSTRSSRPR